ncbi:MAG: hypothetical protein IT377_31875 [Polyangiaceae bacterium]|nr:hypothetical protein [Polyangiaceae bacterium]
MTTTEEARRPLWRRLAARVAIVGGVAVAVSVATPWVPREQVLIYRVSGGDPVRRLKVHVTREGESEAALGATLTGASPSFRHGVSLPNGRYVVSVQAERALSDGGVKETSFVRRVTLEGGETILPIEDP